MKLAVRSAILTLVGLFALGLWSDVAFSQGDPRKDGRKGKRDTSAVRDHRVKQSGEHGRRVDAALHFYIRHDSCREELVALMSREDGAAFEAGVTALKDLRTQLIDLQKQLREARKAGDRAAYARITAAIKDVKTKTQAYHERVHTILLKYKEAATRLYKECGRKPRPSRDKREGDRGEKDGTRDAQIRATLNPNPANAEGTVLNLGLTTETIISIQVSDASGTMALSIPAQTYAAGSHQIRIDTANMRPGFYVVRVDAGGTITSLKLAVR